MQNTVNPGVGTRVISAGFPPQDPKARFSNYLKHMMRLYMQIRDISSFEYSYISDQQPQMLLDGKLQTYGTVSTKGRIWQLLYLRSVIFSRIISFELSLVSLSPTPHKLHIIINRGQKWRYTQLQTIISHCLVKTNQEIESCKTENTQTNTGERLRMPTQKAKS